MTDAALSASRYRTQSGDTMALGKTILFTCLGLLVAAVLQLPDPLVRHDDFPALLLYPDLYYIKTLEEGRWLNHLWHLRGFVWPAWANYLIYTLSWGVYLGSVVHLAFGPSVEQWRKVAVALFAGLSAPALMISLWFNTLIPGMVLIALYALLCTRLSARQGRLLLLIFVPITLTCYTTYPFFLLAVCLIRSDAQRSLRDLAVVVGLFIASFALAMLAIYTLNYLVHGVFGIPMAEWRKPNPVTDLASLQANLLLVVEFLVISAQLVSFHVLPLTLLQGVIFAAAVFVVWQRNAWQAIYPLAGITLGLGLIFLQTVKTGIILPPRVSGFVWVFFAVLVGHLSLALQDKGARMARLGNNMVLFLAMIFVALNLLQHRDLVAWQGESRAMAAAIGPGTDPVYVTGTYLSLETAKRSGVQYVRGVEHRLHYLTGRPVIMCERTPRDCDGLPDDVRAGSSTAEYELRTLPEGVALMLSPVAIREAMVATVVVE